MLNEFRGKRETGLGLWVMENPQRILSKGTTGWDLAFQEGRFDGNTDEALLEDKTSGGWPGAWRSSAVVWAKAGPN